MVKATVSEAHPDTMDFLSRAWCNLAIQAFQPELQDHSLVLHENSLVLHEHPLVLQENSLVLQENVSFNKFECDTKPPFPVSLIGFNNLIANTVCRCVYVCACMPGLYAQICTVRHTWAPCCSVKSMCIGWFQIHLFESVHISMCTQTFSLGYKA